jgi:putative copper export protein
VYVGSIAVAGAVLFALSFPRAAGAVAPELRRQAIAGFLILLLAEPLRYAVFQLAIADGDWSLAFGPDLISMGLQTPIGQAAAVRLVAAAVIVAAGLRVRLVGLAAALAMIGSFLFEGHTASSELRLALAVLLFLHLAAVHWWLGALLPLMALTRRAEPATVAATMEAFGSWAVWIVTTLLVAGALLAIVLTGAEVRPERAYQQRLVVKLVLVAAILAIAAWNKLRLTPLATICARRRAARVHTLEIAAALAILAASAWLVATRCLTRNSDQRLPHGRGDANSAARRIPDLQAEAAATDTAADTQRTPQRTGVVGHRRNERPLAPSDRRHVKTRPLCDDYATS